MNQRQSGILEKIRSAGGASVRDLAAQFHVSDMTIRRDLSLLETRGDLSRTHGGAVSSRAGIIEFAFKEKERLCAAEKQAIAAEAASLVRPGMTITLDTGTTTLEVARRVAGTRRLTVLTSSLPIASVLYASEGIDLILLGGQARKGIPDLWGRLTEENLKRFRVDMAIIGADGANREGLYTTDMNVARVSEAMLAGARRRVAVIDHRKFESAHFVKFASWGAIDRVITDAGTPPAVRRWLGKAVRHVTYAKT
jgi:DeoR family fructose operon transcriptional repressor